MTSFFDIAREIVTPPHARDDAPWCDIGPITDGTLYAHPVADNALMLSTDKEGKRDVCVEYDGASVGAEIVIHGRRFDVVRL